MTASTGGYAATARADPAPGNVRPRSTGFTWRPKTARRNECKAFRVLRELVGELHGDAAAEAVTDHGDPVDLQRCQQVSHSVGIAAEAVVRPWFVRSAMSEQIRRQHR